ncbi:MAG: (d)CMP kinase [Gammaproteobacteria bacterium]|nr:(d)CMP kinase [Gammaproteobacteria bacterium]
MNNPISVITIDGPSASGKGTVSALVAQMLNWHLLDSGALYRLVALAALRRGVSVADRAQLVSITQNLDVAFRVATAMPGAYSSSEIETIAKPVINRQSPAAQQPKPTETTLFLDGEAVTQAIRTEQCGEMASQIAVIPEVRSGLLKRQRDFRKSPGLVADGRDMGTVVFPDALLKVFLTASVEERAKRRYKQLMEKGVSVNLADLFGEISNRDKRDSQRVTAPLKPAADAVNIDTTDTTIHQVVEEIISLYHRRCGG